MADLEYSIEARNILNVFHGVENIVYVEGENDIPFWEFLFEKFTNIKVKAEEVGGKDKLKSRINEIKNGSGSFFVATDSDFDWLNNEDTHPQIFETFGYSIENSIISDESLQQLISCVAGISIHKVDKKKCREWLSSLEEDVYPLILADAVNRNYDLGFTVIPNNCDCFLVSKKSSKLSAQKLSAHLEKININIAEEFRDKFVAKMQSRGIEWADVLRGHFIISAAFKFIKEYIEELKRVVSISREMLFGSLMLAFKASFNGNHRHYNYYQSIFTHK